VFEENIWTQEGGSGRRLEKTAYWHTEKLYNLYASPNVMMNRSRGWDGRDM